MTHNKNRAHANKSFAKHNPATKYAILKITYMQTSLSQSIILLQNRLR